MQWDVRANVAMWSLWYVDGIVLHNFVQTSSPHRHLRVFLRARVFMSLMYLHVNTSRME